MNQAILPNTFTRFRNFMILTLTCGLAASNVFFLTVHTHNKYRDKTPVDFEPGLQFAMMKDILRNDPGLTEVGWLTDKDMSREKNDGIFLQAQYFLAPLLVRLGEEDHRYIVIDSVNIPYLVPTIKRLKSMRLTNNEYGQALLRRNEASLK